MIKIALFNKICVTLCLLCFINGVKAQNKSIDVQEVAQKKASRTVIQLQGVLYLSDKQRDSLYLLIVQRSLLMDSLNSSQTSPAKKQQLNSNILLLNQKSSDLFSDEQKALLSQWNLNHNSQKKP